MPAYSRSRRFRQSTESSTAAYFNLFDSNGDFQYSGLVGAAAFFFFGALLARYYTDIAAMFGIYI